MKVKEWKEILRKFRTSFPVESPVEVRRNPCKKYNGSTRFDGKKFLVQIDSDLSSDQQIGTLIHEWAHIMTIEDGYKHGVTWATNHSKVYGVIVEP